jgi:hypothetical protein
MRPVLIIDLDGTLILKDIFRTIFFYNLRKNPFKIIFLLIKKRSWVNFKKCLLEQLRDNQLEYYWAKYQNATLLKWIEIQREKFGQVSVVSASPQEFVEKIIPKDMFTEIYGSTDKNLKGINKLSFIWSKWGKEFAYIGNDNSDKVIFEASVLAYRVNADGNMHKIKDVYNLG